MILAVRQINATRYVARMRATLDFIEKSESSDHYTRITRQFSALRRSNTFLTLVDPTDADRPLRFALLGYLNHYETMALFIRKGALDEGAYRDWISGSLVRDWNDASEFIQRERWGWNDASRTWIYDERLFSELQTLACKWSRDAIRLSPTSSPPPEEAPSAADEPLPPVVSTEDSPPPELGL